MSILACLKSLEQSEIYKLCLDNTVLGLRVKYYSITERVTNYYDFKVEYVSDADLRRYLTEHQSSFKSLKLDLIDGVACTEDERNGAITVKEFKDEVSACKVLREVIAVLTNKEMS